MHKKRYLSALLAAVLLSGCSGMLQPLDRQMGYTPTAVAGTTEATQPGETETTPEALPDTDPENASESHGGDTEGSASEDAPTGNPEQPDTAPTEETPPETTSPWVVQKTDREDVSNIPHYYQTDYPDQMYGDGTLGRNGGSAACLAMVASYFTGKCYTPSEIARYFGGKAQSDAARLEFGSNAMSLMFHRVENIDYAMQELQEGKILIVMEGKGSWFTHELSTHFILLTGYNDQGLIEVLDPYEPNYEDWYLKDKFPVGFTYNDILAGYQAAWVYDKSAMPEHPHIYEPPANLEGIRYPDLRLTQEERDLLAKVIWGEARGEPFEGQQAVAEVVLNRMMMDGFPDSLSAVVNAEEQFASKPNWYKATPNQTQYDAIDGALYGPYVLPTNVTRFSTGRIGLEIYRQIGGHYFFYQPKTWEEIQAEKAADKEAEATESE